MDHGQEVDHAPKGLTMEIGFRFEVIYKDSDLLEVRVAGWNGAFGGAADVYVGIRKLEEAAAKLKGFPNHPSDTREVILGAFGSKTAGGGVSIRFYCADASGHAFVESRIESDPLSGKPVQCVSFSFPIEAAAVDSFVDELCRLGIEKRGSARLRGLPAVVRT
jgi:hypothetical protein